MKTNDEDRITIFSTLVLLTGLPLLLFLFGEITRQTAFWLFLPTVALVLAYLIASRFIRKGTELPELGPMEAMSFRDFDSSEVDTVIRVPNPHNSFCQNALRTFRERHRPMLKKLFVT